MKIYYHMWLLNTLDILESLYVVFGFKVNNFVNMIFFLQLGVNNEFFQYIYIYSENPQQTIQKKIRYKLQKIYIYFFNMYITSNTF